MTGSQLQVRLYRDSFNTPWGFRLQGGKDLGQALSIQRVFSNSPAEGELQRGDLILAIGGRDGNELTHKQALDLIKHGGGQIQLVIQRPAPGRVSSTATFKPQRPRAPSLQVDKLRENETPATEAFVKFRLERLQRLKNGEMLNDLSPVYPAMVGPGGHYRQHHHNPCYNPNFSKQYSPSSPHYPPPWATPNFAPKKVSKLSRLGGGGQDFGVDYGSHYGTVPRRRHSTQISSSMTNLHTAGAHPARVTSLSQLGGGGYEFGTDYCTLPRKPRRQSSQPPGSYATMPTSGSYGFQPKKVTLSSLGGGGPSFGSDFTRSGYSQPMHVQTGGRGQQTNVEMLNRVQESLDNISLSPRTPDYYQPPPFGASPISPGGGGQYIPTGVRLDMEREEEQRRKQQQQQQQQQRQMQQQQYQPPPQQYQPPPPQQYQAPPQQYQPPPQQQQYQPAPQQYQPEPYVPTGVRLEQQMGEQAQDEEFTPVSQRRTTFLNAPARPAAITGKQSAPKILRPKSGSSGFDFGVDYTKPQSKTSTVTWKPQSVQRPVNVPPPQAEIVQSTPPAWNQGQQQDDEEYRGPPAWRNTLRTTGVKPWDSDLEYSAGQSQAPRSVAYQPGAGGKAPASAPFNPTPPQGQGQDGPKVVHLQYNSPMGLYSKENVNETFAGQTKALASGAPSPGSAPVKNPANTSGDRDWTQSAVYRMIYEEENRGGPRGGAPRQSAPMQQQQAPQQQSQQQHQQQRAPPPPPAPKPPVATFQQSFTPVEDEFGISDF